MTENIRLLLIEDNPGDAFLMKDMLTATDEERSFDVVVEERLSGGIKRLAEGFDVILLDLGLPDSKGLNTLLDLQKVSGQVPVIIATALADEALAIRAVRSGAQDYLIKGKIDPVYLIRSIRYAIARKAGLLKMFTLSELQAFDGREGRPAYIAFGGNVYDASGSRMWKNGTHAARHSAGHDLTSEIRQAPHGEDLLLRLPLIGQLQVEETISSKIISGIESLHFHPMIVHFTIAYSFASAFFLVLHLVLGLPLLEYISFVMLLLSFVSIPFAALSGLFSWRVTYHGERSRIFTIKSIMTFSMFLTSGAASLWRLLDPSLLSSAGPDYLYVILVFSLPLQAAVSGHYGGRLVYP